jgi:hypothetical protein
MTHILSHQNQQSRPGNGSRVYTWSEPRCEQRRRRPDRTWSGRSGSGQLMIGRSIRRRANWCRTDLLLVVNLAVMLLYWSGRLGVGSGVRWGELARVLLAVWLPPRQETNTGASHKRSEKGANCGCGKQGRFNKGDQRQPDRPDKKQQSTSVPVKVASRPTAPLLLARKFIYWSNRLLSTFGMCGMPVLGGGNIPNSWRYSIGSASCVLSSALCFPLHTRH